MGVASDLYANRPIGFTLHVSEPRAARAGKVLGELGGGIMHASMVMQFSWLQPGSRLLPLKMAGALQEWGIQERTRRVRCAGSVWGIVRCEHGDVEAFVRTASSLAKEQIRPWAQRSVAGLVWLQACNCSAGAPWDPA